MALIMGPTTKSDMNTLSKKGKFPVMIGASSRKQSSWNFGNYSENYITKYPSVLRVKKLNCPIVSRILPQNTITFASRQLLDHNPVTLPKDEQQQQESLYARVRFATKSDIPFIHKLIHKMASYYDLSNECEVTESSLLSTIFNDPQHSNTVNVFLIEASPKEFAPQVEHDPYVSDGAHQPPNPLTKTVHLSHPVDDPEESSFRTNDGTLIVGFVIYYQSYSTFLGKPGIHLEDLFIREGYRGLGFGSMLLKALANLTVRLGYARMEWTVTTWNVSSHKFYEKMGAHLLPEWRIFRLDDDSLLSYSHL